MKEKIILVSNDDSVYAPGIRALVEAVQPFGKVVVVAPAEPQSAMSSALTIRTPLRLKEVSVFNDLENVTAYACYGTPVDCVKLALDKVLDEKPDLCVSGINHGSNSSVNVIYSGTIAAAMEAAMSGIPSIGFSHLSFDHKADLTAAKAIVQTIIKKIDTQGMPPCHLLNVNVPDGPLTKIKGLKICRQAQANWVEAFEERTDPIGRKYYWLMGEFVNHDNAADTDEYALENNYVSVCPIQFDLTAHKDKKWLEDTWDLTV